MNDYAYPDTRPCDDYEFEIVELLDGAAAPERAAHRLAAPAVCARCQRVGCGATRQWMRRLAAPLPSPRLSPEFGAQLQARIDRSAPTTLDRRCGARRGRARIRTHDRLGDAAAGWRCRAVLNGTAPRSSAAFCSGSMHSRPARCSRATLEFSHGRAMTSVALGAVSAAQAHRARRRRSWLCAPRACWPRRVPAARR